MIMACYKGEGVTVHWWKLNIKLYTMIHLCNIFKKYIFSKTSIISGNIIRGGHIKICVAPLNKDWPSRYRAKTHPMNIQI